VIVPRLTLFPTTRLAALIAVAGGLWLVPGRGAAVVAIAVLTAIVAAIVLDYLRLPFPSDLQVRRELPDRMGIGDDNVIRYEVSSSAPRAATARLYDAVPAGLSASIDESAFLLEPATRHRREVAAVGESRGRHVFGPLAIRLESKLGLLARVVRVDAPAETVVVPSLANVRRLRLLAVQNRLSEVGVRALRQRGDGNAFAGLREYAPGDDPRLLDWKATARHGHPIVREQTVERSQTVFAMIDCGRAMTQLAGRYSRFEHVLSAALVLSDVASTSGDRVGLVAFDHDIRAFVPAQKGSAALRALRTSLSALDATMSEPDYAAAFRLLALRQRRRALVVFFTDVIDVRAARAFIAYAGRAAQRHMLLVVAIQNEELLAAARPMTAGSAALFRSAAAEELIREREESLARMRAVGITVLDVAAGHMAAAVVNRYLEIKARGLL
jgi:uncharacterized protein (DUF58 family)